MQKQSDEFDAMADLAKAWNGITMTPIVDDDYPEVRHRYEGALRTFLKACEANGRAIQCGQQVESQPLERDKIIEAVRTMTTKLNEYVKALAELDVNVELEVDTFQRQCVGQVQVPVKRIKPAFSQEL